MDGAPTHMSFRGRLTLFFLLIVVLPMIVLAVLVTQIATDSTNGKADARLAEGLDSGLTVYRDAAKSAGDAAKKAAHDPQVTAAITSGDGPQENAAARGLIGQHGIRAASLESAKGEGAPRAPA